MSAFTDKRALLDAAARLREWGLGKGTAGNLSLRVEGGMLITATGAAWETLGPEDLVAVRFDGRGPGPSRAPSSEWRFHRDVYLARPELQAIVHAHSTFCTTLACLRREIPAVHYMIAVTGRNRVPCAAYATFGTEALSHEVVRALDGGKACLLANHGMVAAGTSLEDALKVAREVEILAEQYWRALQVGEPVILDDAEMARVHQRFQGYGQPPRRAKAG